ncbi:hypothetical protein AVEN_131197-1 [Araneus ventricosus]|uniref:Integrase catalytic domain-containing protein n=1 Tax=Araneus ventricosus TaxID=182803 RepID=A0A4Y2PGI5_ARAVE|nr:hypothetical protein AVEN_131197-1 [Araneus ventricosus]
MIFSDNGKNFVSANLELKRLILIATKRDDCLSNFISEEDIQWTVHPPRAHNFGGVWEAGVKSFKFLFKSVVEVSKLTYEEFYTILQQTEVILNSRPLTPLSSDMEDLEFLTPRHFVIGRPITAIAEPNLTNVENNLSDHMEKVAKQLFKYHATEE